jgi:hypothetical protein
MTDADVIAALERSATALERIAVSLERVANHYAPEKARREIRPAVLSTATYTREEQERRVFHEKFKGKGKEPK